MRLLVHFCKQGTKALALWADELRFSTVSVRGPDAQPADRSVITVTSSLCLPTQLSALRVVSGDFRISKRIAGRGDGRRETERHVGGGGRESLGGRRGEEKRESS